jgi:hypothetical protein
VIEEITHATHYERQFMQYLEAVGWIKAGLLPDSPSVVEKRLARGWIERKPGPADRVLYRITEKGTAGKKARIP